MNDFKIGTRSIGKGHKPFIIAEMSGNHNQSIERALEIVDAAAATGVDAIKLQTYTADTITVKGAFTINDPQSLWHGKELHELYQQAYTPWDWHKIIFDRARKKGIMAFSSPFDTTSVDFLEELDVPAYKIASFENTDWTLLKKVANTGKPVIVSTGVANFSDIKESVEILRAEGCTQIILLKCTSTYPASPENSNIVTIPYMEDFFGCPIGISDHTMGIGVSVAAVALGACVIEKHFTIRRSDGGVDSAFSMEPAEMKLLVEEANKAKLSIGQIQTTIQEAEKKSLLFKRSLFAVKDIEEGSIITYDDIKSFRPAIGLETKHLDTIVGKKAKKLIAKGTPITWDLI